MNAVSKGPISILGKIKRKITFIFTRLDDDRKWKEIVDHLHSKEGFEFGGPTMLFQDKTGMLLYPYIAHLDGGNILKDNPFQGSMDSDFKYFEDKKGKQYDIDAANENDIKKIDRTYDFLLSSHHIEHIANPIKAIKSWKKILKPDGMLLAILPDKNVTFDNKRPLTSLEHIIEDHEKNVGEDDETHAAEQRALHDWSRGGLEGFNELSKNNLKTRVVHHHCFDIDLVKKLFAYCGYECIRCYQRGSNIIYLGKIT